MKTLSYEEALEKVETWIEESGIREVCVDICKGKCCLQSKNKTCTACINSKDKNIFCSIFICSNLTQVLNIYDSERFDEYLKLRHYLIAENEVVVEPKSVYYTLFSKEEKESFFFDKYLFEKMLIPIPKVTEKHKLEVKRLIDKNYWN